MTDSLQPSDPSVLSSVQAALGSGFQVERELGGGGMSRVFVATETALARRIAVKVLSPELSQGVSAERFAREVALAAKLQDPHIVPVLATGATADGLPWYTMPFIEGESLRARMLRGAIPLDDALRILRDVAEALEYAHERGIVHRDIKPENVLLSGRSALVTDFGIAKAVSAARGTASNATLTSIGLSLGTPAYMAPEQVAADGVDHRSDLYSWGIVAYELLAGAHPFATRTQAAQLMAAHLSEVPAALDEVRPGLPPSLVALVMQCLAKSPAERPADAAALLSALGVTTTDPTLRSSARLTTTASKARSRTMLVAAIVLVSVLAGGAWFAKSGASAAGGSGGEAAMPALAVLPFEHQGDSADLYLTDGVTDEIRSKLAGVRELIVIARTSSNAYRNTTKSPNEIGKELGVRWLLTGTVRVTGDGAGRRVIVRPELVEVTATGQPQSRWGQPFDVSGADVLGLQADVASQVVAAMEVPIVTGADRARLGVVPTRDPQAYDLYLRGRAATGFGSEVTPAAIQTAMSLFEQAVARDSTYVAAWHGVAVSRINLYIFRPSPELAAAARAAAERTKALDPTGAGAKSMAGYFRLVAGDIQGALAETELALRTDPNDAAASSSLGASLMELGRIDEAFETYERALRRDPRHLGMLRTLSLYYALRGRFADARATVERQRALIPLTLSTFERRMSIELLSGDTAATRRILAEAQQSVPRDQLFRLLVNNGYAWLPAPADVRAFLARGPEASLGTDSTTFLLWKADFAWLTGDSAGQRAWGDSARRGFARRVAALPTNPGIRSEYAQALAHAGRRTEALREAREALALVLAQGSDRRSGTYSISLDLAATVAMYVGDHAAALDWLEEMRTLPLHWSSGYLRVNPYYASLHGDQRFERLTADAAR